MNEGTVIRLGSVELDDCEFEWSFYLGPEPRRVIIRQPIEKFADLAGLPYITTLEFTVSAEDETAKPAHETRVIEGVRVLEVREVDDKVCEVHLGDCRHDVGRRVCPADFNLLWRDGYLQATDLPDLGRALQYLSDLVPELEANLEAPADPEDPIPDGMVQAGGNLVPALAEIGDAVNRDIGVHANGLLAFRGRGTSATIPLNVQAFSWVQNFEPSWLSGNRKVRGLPQVIRLLYPEKHVIRAELFGAQATVTPDPLRVELVQVYRYGGEFLVLDSLIHALGLQLTRAFTDDDIARVYNTNSFEGTAAEPVGEFDSDGKALISIIKRDWRRLYKVFYTDPIGRRGGWSELTPGIIEPTTDKDGNTRVDDDISARCVRAEWTEWLSRAEQDLASGIREQSSIRGATVARSHVRKTGFPLPDAPFSARWESPEDLVLRIEPGDSENAAERLWLGVMVDESGNRVTELRISESEPIADDQGNVGTIKGVRIPEISDVRFEPQARFRMEVFMVGIRRLPNSQARWTAVDIEGFPEGDLPVLELEVGDELYALRDYVGGFEGKQALADGRGLVLNMDVLQSDAERRADIVKDRMNAPLEGEGIAQGLAAFDIDLGNGVRELVVAVRNNLVVSKVVVGNTDNEELRRRRAQSRHTRRGYAAGGKSARGAAGVARSAPVSAEI